jgi:hypothetical protein
MKDLFKKNLNLRLEDAWSINRKQHKFGTGFSNIIKFENNPLIQETMYRFNDADSLLNTHSYQDSPVFIGGVDITEIFDDWNWEDD